MRTTTSTSQAPLGDHQESNDEEGKFFEEANTVTENITPPPPEEEAPSSPSRTPKLSGTTALPPITSYLPVHRPPDDPPTAAEIASAETFLAQTPLSDSTLHTFVRETMMKRLIRAGKLPATNPKESIIIPIDQNTNSQEEPDGKDERETEIEDDSNILFFRDLPPVTVKKKRVITFTQPNATILPPIEEEDHSRFYQYSIENSRGDSRNTQTSFAARHVGTQRPRTSEPEIRLGKGCLRESIPGPQYFRGSNEPLYDTSANIHYNELPQPSDNSIWTDKSPISQSSRHSDEDGDRNWNYGLPGGPPGADQPPNPQPKNAQGQQGIFKFEKKIKVSDIPTWDGNGDTILDWLDYLNHISYLNLRVYNDLGLIAPLRLTDAAERWFYALDPPQQQYIQQNWGNFRRALSTYFMNPQWFNRMKARTLRMRYGQKGHEQELPSDYFHRKLRMIQEVFVQTPSETIMEIMNGAPRYWSILIDTSRINTIADLQYHIKYREDQLVRNPETQSHDLEKRIKALESRSHQRPC